LLYLSALHFYKMTFYRFIAFSLVILGIFQIVYNLSWPLDITPDSLEKSAIGLCTIFIGLLNLAYLYEVPSSSTPMIGLLGANLIFIGFAILLITSEIGVIYGYIALVLSLINCVMVLNHKV